MRSGHEEETRRALADPVKRRSILLFSALLIAIIGFVSPLETYAGDFNGDGKADVFWRHTAGSLDIWFLNGTSVAGSGSLGTMSPDWQIAAIGDFNGDGKADLFWRHTAGYLNIWLMNGTRLAGGGNLGTITPDWQIAGISDFNGDGKADLLWRHTAGYLNVWFMNGARLAGGGSLGTMSPDWQIAGIGDFNGDGKADLLRRHTAGALDIWLLNGTSTVGSGSLGTMSPDWQVVAIGDFNGDGKADLLRRHTSGALDIWLLNGTNTAGSGNLGQLENEWQIQGDQPTPFLAFTATFVSYPRVTATIGDVNEDGSIEAVGSANDGQGNLQVVSPYSVGLGALFISRNHRDARFADFNGDGHLDIISNTYADIANTNSMALLFFGNGDGTFSEDPQLRSKSIRGYGETIVVADFDNDGDVDIFIPYYTFNSTTEKCYLLLNDGQGHFTDISDQAGVSLRNRPLGLRPEGAQAVDFDNDGWIDLYVAGHLLMNNRNLTFTDRRAALGLPELFDEGIKFLDWNNDGYLDLVIHNPVAGPRLFEFDGTIFREKKVFPTQSYNASYGINIYDLNNDGREDIVTAGGNNCNTIVHLNTEAGFVRARSVNLDYLCQGTSAPAFGDINKDGRIDMTLIERFGTYRRDYFRNDTRNQNSWFSVEVLGSKGEKNQFGRVVRISPVLPRNVTFTRVVDGGAGYLSQNQYALLIGTPYLEPHRVEVSYPGRKVVFTITPGRTARVFADGRVEVSN